MQRLGTRTDTPDSLQNIKADSHRAGLDERCEIERSDIVINKRMALAFFEMNLSSLFTFHRVDTVVVTGGSTSGCVRATVVDGLSRSPRMIVPEECVSDKHESPHFANLTWPSSTPTCSLSPRCWPSWSSTSRRIDPSSSIVRGLPGRALSQNRRCGSRRSAA